MSTLSGERELKSKPQSFPSILVFIAQMSTLYMEKVVFHIPADAVGA